MLLTVVLLASGCGQASQGHLGPPGDPNLPDSQQQAKEEKLPPVLLDRYAILICGYVKLYSLGDSILHKSVSP